MKFHWFNLMPWPDLPDDFRETHNSVWVDVDSRLYDPVRGHEVYNDYLDMLEFAADQGFDGIGVNEHHQNAYGMMPSPQIMARRWRAELATCRSCCWVSRSPTTTRRRASPKRWRCWT